MLVVVVVGQGVDDEELGVGVGDVELDGALGVGGGVLDHVGGGLVEDVSQGGGQGGGQGGEVSLVGDGGV